MGLGFRVQGSEFRVSRFCLCQSSCQYVCLFLDFVYFSILSVLSLCLFSLSVLSCLSALSLCLKSSSVCLFASSVWLPAAGTANTSEGLFQTLIAGSSPARAWDCLFVFYCQQQQQIYVTQKRGLLSFFVLSDFFCVMAIVMAHSLFLIALLSSCLVVSALSFRSFLIKRKYKENRIC